MPRWLPPAAGSLPPSPGFPPPPTLVGRRWRRSLLGDLVRSGPGRAAHAPVPCPQAYFAQRGDRRAELAGSSPHHPTKLSASGLVIQNQADTDFNPSVTAPLGMRRCAPGRWAPPAERPTPPGPTPPSPQAVAPVCHRRLSPPARWSIRGIPERSNSPATSAGATKPAPSYIGRLYPGGGLPFHPGPEWRKVAGDCAPAGRIGILGPASVAAHGGPVGLLDHDLITRRDQTFTPITRPLLRAQHRRRYNADPRRRFLFDPAGAGRGVSTYPRSPLLRGSAAVLGSVAVPSGDTTLWARLGHIYDGFTFGGKFARLRTGRRSRWGMMWGTAGQVSGLLRLPARESRMFRCARSVRWMGLPGGSRR